MSSDLESIIERLGAREVIGQAIAVLMGRDGISRDAAFERLVQGSSDSRRKVREIAAEILQQLEGDCTEPSGADAGSTQEVTTESTAVGGVENWSAETRRRLNVRQADRAPVNQVQ